MTETKLDLQDIQGNVIKAYPRHGLPKGRYLFYQIDDGEAGRQFLQELCPHITTSAPWGSKAARNAPPKYTINIAFTYDGLKHLGLPQATLQSFPEEFAMGMRGRSGILGDDGPSAPARWDPIWTREGQVHVFIAINAADESQLETATRVVQRLARQSGAGVVLIRGHRGDGDADDLPFQDVSALYDDQGRPNAKEHFGYTDGISNPYFKGIMTDSSNVVGGGKVTGGDIETEAGWEPLETGEFLLGYQDEAFEWPEAPQPPVFAANGTFLVYRKLHENVGSFDRYLQTVGQQYPGGPEELAAKLAGRWRNGAPITTFRTQSEADGFAAEWEHAKAAIASATTVEEREAAKRRFSALNRKFSAFDYTKDIAGGGCPVGAHVRRSHPRSGLEFNVDKAFQRPDALSNRRRLLRRGLPYGRSDGRRRDEDNHGIIFMSLGASIRRQFEFVQQQWINYGNDFRLGNDKDPLAGNHGLADSPEGAGRAVIEGDPDRKAPPFFCANLPRFVETRGGDYFFVPSMTALRMIADGDVDPT